MRSLESYSFSLAVMSALQTEQPHLLYCMSTVGGRGECSVEGVRGEQGIRHV